MLRNDREPVIEVHGLAAPVTAKSDMPERNRPSGKGRKSFPGSREHIRVSPPASAISRVGVS